MNVAKVILIFLTYVFIFEGGLCEIHTTTYNATIGNRVPNIFRTIANVSKVRCCTLCNLNIECKCVNYNSVTKVCELSKYFQGSDDDDWISYSKPVDWTLVLRGTRGAGSLLYAAWIDGISVTTDDVTCMTTDVTSCSQHYRDPIVDSWSSLGITMVKFAFFKNGDEVAYVIFDALGSDSTNWFSQSRIINSTWPTLKTQSFNLFSISGHNPGRHFFINPGYGGCPGDKAYLLVIDSGHWGCNYDKFSSYPQFYYANTATFGYPESMKDVDLADVVAIFIR